MKTTNSEVRLNCTIVELARILKTTPEKLLNIKITTLEEVLDKYVKMSNAKDDFDRLAKSLNLYD